MVEGASGIRSISLISDPSYVSHFCLIRFDAVADVLVLNLW